MTNGGRDRKVLTRLKHIKTTKHVLADGASVTYYYHRRTGKRIEGKPGTQEFIDNYARASKSDSTVLKDTLAGLILDYKASSIFSNLKPRTRQDYDKHLHKIRDKWGATPLEVLEDRRIRKDLLRWRDELAKRSLKQADYTLSVFRLLIQFGVDMGVLAHNHLSRPRRLYKPDRTDKIWLPDDVTKFMRCASEKLKAAMIIALHTGQRQGDLIRLTWTAYDGTSLTLRQSKGGRNIYIPCTMVLKHMLDNMERNSTVILTNSRNLPWTSDGFRTSWYKATKKSGVKGLTFHDLRGTAVTILAEQGCTRMEIAAITGHSLRHVDAILDTYASRTKSLAQAAILKFEGSWVSEVGK